METDVNIQKEYYELSAKQYDEMHSDERPHEIAMRYISYFVDLLNIQSVLDVGCGTGRGLSGLTGSRPALRAIGIEPVEALLKQAVEKNGVASDNLICGSGTHLPFADNSFDAVCEFAVLHHVAHPDVIVKEMIRVARKAVFISDSNRFGQGRLSARALKLLLWKLKLWGLTNYVVTQGKNYRISEGDGLFYSYSVYDSAHLLSDWADRMIFVPTEDDKLIDHFQPLLTSSHILVCAIKE
jgi:ubiquinone/menaquinone biosynthesis C-methylase UbiE